MCEIKFRGRGAYQRSVWYVGDLVRCDDGRITIRENEANEFYVEPATVGQYTGLKDSEGEEIYEGDVIRTDDWSTPSYIRWDDVTASFVVDRWSVNLAHVAQIKVIGNVHDNPELLERKP